jgi:Kef-type K+ transport system membrane component KefB
MVSRNTQEFVVGLVAAGVVTGFLAFQLPTAYALAVGLATGTPSLVRTSARLDRERYDREHSTNDQLVDGAIAAVSTAAVGLLAGFLALSNGFAGAIPAALAAAGGVFAGQVAFYARNRDYIE